MSILAEISEALQKGKRKQVTALVQQALDEGIPAPQILNEGLLAGMDVIGVRFRDNEIFVPEVLVAARAMNAGAELLKPHLAEAGAVSKGKIALGTVKGDLHDIGKNLVRMMFEGKGFEVIDLGVDVAPEAFVKAVQEQDCGIVACSALLTTTMPVMGEVVKALEAAGLRDKVKVMVGGAPVNQEFAASIGADAYTDDAASAADKAAELIG
ncbi:5-methyltetrahydrofolate--homocysteine methyltransferase [Flavonifractor sp. An82]|uniref:corrinoid protein n=1 Tax=Flavonifractor sp. An82 TaxID=1965660 RepID=UPI000B38F154|nr:corrinoid protein [Flavonifractor sp. An82]OUN21164.1 5-methyltetrahydrofolate--homocysteine methyltransferase [Flavonifractor sp. An82]